ncbi:MAG: diadenylate cyclase CdaA [Chlamydiota bacterium]|nr:diadenylate cyclase CdaA [Chlamydiota bacterium]
MAEYLDPSFIIKLWRPALEVLFMGTLFYYLFGLIRGTRAVQVLKGLVVLIIIFIVAQHLQLDAVNWLLTKIFPVAMLALIVIFQPELRQALARLGANPFLPNLARNKAILNVIATSAGILSKKRIGALIAIEDEVGLKNYIESGVSINSHVSVELLISIFFPNTPLHDGGVVIQSDQVAAAACLFPLTQRQDLAKTMGTRHRAALGLSEETDALVIVVSEETGQISVAMYGKFLHDLSEERLKEVIVKRLFRVAEKKSLFQRWRAR